MGGLRNLMSWFELQNRHVCYGLTYCKQKCLFFSEQASWILDCKQKSPKPRGTVTHAMEKFDRLKLGENGIRILDEITHFRIDVLTVTNRSISPYLSKTTSFSQILHRFVPNAPYFIAAHKKGPAQHERALFINNS